MRVETREPQESPVLRFRSSQTQPTYNTRRGGRHLFQSNSPKSVNQVKFFLIACAQDLFCVKDFIKFNWSLNNYSFTLPQCQHYISLP